jgi:hypothetical protein
MLLLLPLLLLPLLFAAPGKPLSQTIKEYIPGEPQRAFLKQQLS